MGDIIRFTGSTAESITADDVYSLLTLHNRVERNRALHEQIAESIMARLRDGAEIDTGCHDVELRFENRDGIREEQLVIDQVIRYRRVTGPAHRLIPKSTAALDP